ncbi:MAG: hypothetical protein HOV79_17885 [Hamadaea sp.]|nr:hypothetical protein [Hamadaea sp.]
MIIPRDALKRLYLVGNRLHHLPPTGDSVPPLIELLDEALRLSAYVTVDELGEGFDELEASIAGVRAACGRARATEHDLVGVWSGPAQEAFGRGVTAVTEQLTRVESAIYRAGEIRNTLTGGITEVTGVIETGRGRLAAAYELTSGLGRLVEAFGEEHRFVSRFEQAQREGTTGVSLVHQAWVRFDRISADARDALDHVRAALAAN